MPETVYTQALAVGFPALLLEVPGLLEALGDRGEEGPAVYPLVAPPSARLPYVVWQRISGVGEHHLEGRSALARARIQTKAYALTYEQAAQLAELLRRRLDGTLHGVQAAGLDVRRLARLDEVDDYEPPNDGTEAGAFSVRQDWELWYGVP